MEGRSITKTDYTQSPAYSVNPADGVILRITREQAILTFYVEHIDLERKDNVTDPKHIVRELRFEIRLPTSAAALMAASIGQILRQLSQDPTAEMHFTAPAFKADIVSSGELFKTGNSEKK
ncbi:MAG: hypothetical protein HY296_03555 [Thaumarchaeota archaeon]|nr:hypothetical protein [Nitrososphaerota archaeon]